ncbi:MAG: hypothetical protein IKU85_02190 [Bacteroidaceae bacterium]|nr:hypothetical protein [Bacteroidaceae bacterium]
MMTYKKLLFALISTASIAFTSCSSDNEEMTTNEPQMVNVKLDFTFEQSGDMTRANGAETYAAFYEKYIKTKKLTPKNYSLSFINKATGQEILSKKGMWEKKEGIQLPEGKYIISGISHPIEKYSDAPSDSVYMSFYEEVEITQNTYEITLSAKYASFLLLFDVNNIRNILLADEYNTAFPEDNKMYKKLTKDDNCYWLFMVNNWYGRYTANYGATYSYDYYSFVVQLMNENTAKFELSSKSFDRGKYYFYQYNDISTSYNIPEMQPGN